MMKNKVICDLKLSLNVNVNVYTILLCSILAVLGQLNHVNGDSAPVGICAMPGCNCTIVVHHWINVKCIFSDYQDVEFHEGIIPADASEVSVSRCRELRIHSGAFTGGAQLKRVHVTGIRSVVAKTQAFHNISAPNPLLEVSECNKVVLESQAFKNARGTLTVSISRCQHVDIKPNAFSRLLKFSIREVPTLELSSNAFKFDAPPSGRHGPATQIEFHSVKIMELPSSVFPSAVDEIRMDDIWTKVIRKDAFCAVMIHAVKISNASIFEIESGAFSDETLITNFELVDVRLKTVKSGAFKAGFNNFTIQYSRLTEIETSGIEISAATVAFNYNEFQSLKKNSIILKQWSQITIDYNSFVNLDENAIIADEIAKAETTDLEFSFRGNRIKEAKERSLGFASVSEKPNIKIARVGSNYFEKICNCVMEKWMREITGKNTSASWMMKSSYCLAGEWLEKCLKIPQGYLEILNFTNTICNDNDQVICKEPSEKPTSSASPPSVGPHIYPRQNSFFDVELSDSDQEREKRYFVIFCVSAVIIIITIIIAAGVLYIRRRGVCPKLSSSHLMNFTSSWLSPNSGMTAATSARSISRLSINEYAGLRTETRIIDPDEAGNPTEELEAAGFYTENKATQTLPEELTEECLKDLRDKLNDPDSYSQARDMIEHLYDLIKVEENCNNNNERRLSFQDDNTYDVIAPRIRKSQAHKTTVSMGTKVPSLEKLLPKTRIIRPVVVEYTEPRDQRTSDQNHLYAELPGDETVPSTSRLSQSISANLTGRAPQPLPPDVVNDHLINDKKPRKYADDVQPYQETLLFDAATKRSNSFCRVQNPNTMQVNEGNKKTIDLLFCEYADPRDATNHLYSELPEPAASSTPAKMANRPLPIKPDQENNMNLTRT